MSDRNPRGRNSNSEMSSGSSSSTSSFDSDEETDAQDLKPIRGYLANRRELARQLFRSVKSDKIRMMLPQILKNMNLSELEEWCASELCGMSEARILCILDGQTMLNSSDTDETDDSGPSLEIISDTEEWLTDTDMAAIKKEEASSSSRIPKSKRSKSAKSKAKIHGQMRSDKEKPKVKPKTKGIIAVPNDSNVRVKKEKEKETHASTHKEGESLLDLLELEMRARAIRALIRKEEDVIPSEATEKRIAMSTDALRNTLNSAVSASLTDGKSLNLDDRTGSNGNEKPADESSEKRRDNGEDEDVVFVVVKPTPTIELLSSDGENDEKDTNDKNKKDAMNSTESTKIANQRSSKSRETMPEIISSNDAKKNERIVMIDKSTNGSDSLKIVVTKRIAESSKHTLSPNKTNKTKKIDGEKSDKPDTNKVQGENEKIAEKIIDPDVSQSGRGLFKKIRKKQNLRSKRKIVDNSNIVEIHQPEESSKNLSCQMDETLSNEQNNAVITTVDLPPETTIIKMEIPEKADTSTEESTLTIPERELAEKEELTRPSRVSMDEDKLDDFEEIIDLDDYPDDMDDIESTDHIKRITSKTITNNLAQAECKTDVIVNDAKITTKDNPESAETWASRYYQTDDVQNVIKESKIQSEIRKRLRERQRLSKLNSSPKIDSPIEGNITLEKPEKKIEARATGSVQEYLALKNSASAPVNDVGNIENSPADEETKNPENDAEVRPEISNK